jgi:cytoskeleton protein RodZ
MTSIGETLRQERLRRDLKIEQISRELKISSRFLEAIEDEHFEKLPGGVFAKSFVRQYASYLGLDGEEYAARVRQAADPLASPAPVGPHSLPPVDITLPRVEEWHRVGDRRFNWGSSLHALALMVVVMLICSGVYTFWQRSRRSAQAVAEKPPAVAAVHPPAPAPVQATAPPAAGTPVPGTPQQPPEGAAPAQQDPEPAVAAAASANRPAPDAAAASAPAPAPVNSVPDAAVKVEISATEAVWVSARADGKYIFSGTLQPNEKRSVEAKETLVVRVGNAGGAAITFNGKPIGPVGPEGQIRTLQFTSGGFQIVALPKPSVPLDPL